MYVCIECSSICEIRPDSTRFDEMGRDATRRDIYFSHCFLMTKLLQITPDHPRRFQTAGFGWWCKQLATNYQNVEETLGLHYHSLSRWMSRWSLGLSREGSTGYKMPDSFPSLFVFPFQHHHHHPSTQDLFVHNTEIRQ